MTGGGFVTAVYGDCYVQSPEQHEYALWLDARLTGSFRFIDVPLKTDWMGPFPIFDRFPAPFVTGIPHSDGSLFSDGAGYRQATVFGVVTAAAALNAGVLSLRLYGAARRLRYSDWFSIYHPASRGWRAYRYWDVLSVSAEASETVSGAVRSYRDYSLAIAPALREAVSVGQHVEFAQPRFAAKLAAGTGALGDIEGFWRMRPTLQFQEAF